MKTLQDFINATQSLVVEDIHDMVYLDGDDAVRIAHRIMIEPRWSILYAIAYVEEVRRNVDLDDDQKKETIEAFINEVTEIIYMKADDDATQ